MNSMRHLRAIVALPLSVCGLLPALLLWAFPSPPVTPGWRAALLLLGGILALAGLALLVATTRLFARQGRGTLAPWDPPQTLVVAGVYRQVRNPMILGVILLLFGEAALLASPAVLGWALLAALANAVYIPLSEERGLRQRYGAAYQRYCAHVPRWWPRRRPWDGQC
jgi:protein-S-isoprenylcysteine O-methyltransferase Ste14